MQAKNRLDLITDSAPLIYLKPNLAIAYITFKVLCKDSCGTDLKNELEESQPIFKLSDTVLWNSVNLLLQENILGEYKQNRSSRGRPKKMLKINDSSREQAESLASKWSEYLTSLNSSVNLLQIASKPEIGKAARVKEDSVDVEAVSKAANPKVSLVLNCSELEKAAILKELDRNQLTETLSEPQGSELWLGIVLGAMNLDAIKVILEDTKTDWRDFWSIQACLACSFLTNCPKPDNSPLSEIWANMNKTERGDKILRELLNINAIGLLAGDWLQRIDKSLQPILLLCHGLNNIKGDLSVRNEAIESLFCLIWDTGYFVNLKFKVFLNEDIWQQMRFPNKSHFFGKTFDLKRNR
ncbi:MAG: hypothetical protein F6J93_03680 [Oscillatoria sp. SIO1A7]|nr:hypothetical protein [Oscillatoria sp. SIO1A7]